MTRIIGGSAGGRRLATPPGEATRPTSDRVREAVFSAIEAWAGSLHGLRVLDLYAGSGALGLEAWSRGAAHVTFVERDRRTAGLVTANARTLGCDVADVVVGSVSTALARPPASPYDLVLSDPPYPLGADAVVADLTALREGGWLSPGALVLVERSRRGAPVAWPDGYDAGKVRRYGETVIYFGYAPGADEDEETP